MIECDIFTKSQCTSITQPVTTIGSLAACTASAKISCLAKLCWMVGRADVWTIINSKLSKTRSGAGYTGLCDQYQNRADAITAELNLPVSRLYLLPFTNGFHPVFRHQDWSPTLCQLLCTKPAVPGGLQITLGYYSYCIGYLKKSMGILQLCNVCLKQLFVLYVKSNVLETAPAKNFDRRLN